MTREEAINNIKELQDTYIKCRGEEDTIEVLIDSVDIEALDIAKKVLEQELKWIPVSERLPEPNRLVLCHITTGATETYFLALWNDTLNTWEEGIGGYRLLENDLGYEVIAWMPLPKPYEL